MKVDYCDKTSHFVFLALLAAMGYGFYLYTRVIYMLKITATKKSLVWTPFPKDKDLASSVLISQTMSMATVSYRLAFCFGHQIVSLQSTFGIDNGTVNCGGHNQLDIPLILYVFRFKHT